jgi:outer membrane immunogenic protein
VVYTFACGSINAAPDLCFSGASNGITPGWTAGGGLEYALGQKWSVKGEYLFAQFKETMNVVAVTAAPGSTPASYSANFTTNLNIVRIGLNYKFGG